MARRSKDGKWGEYEDPKDLIHPSLGNHTTTEWQHMGTDQRIEALNYREDAMCKSIVGNDVAIKNKDAMKKGRKQESKSDWKDFYGGEDYMSGPFGPGEDDDSE